MLEKVLVKAVLMILEKLGAWAAEYVAQRYKDWQEDEADKEKEEKFKEAQTKEEKIRNAKDLVDSATKPQS